MSRNVWVKLKFVGFALMTLTLAGCHRHSPSFLAVIPRTTGNALWEPVLLGVSAAVGPHAGVYWNAPPRQEDVEDQVRLVDKEIARTGLEGIILAPDHSVALVSPVQRALAKGLPVVVLSTGLDIAPEGKLAFVLNDEAAGGQLAAGRVDEILHGKGTIAVLGVDIGNLGSQARQASFASSVAKQYPGIRIVTTSFGSSSQPHEQQVAAEVLSQFPQLNAILSLNSTATRGAYFALTESHKAGTVKLIGFDQDTDSIRNGNIDSIVVQDTYQMGYIAALTVKALSHGQTVPPVVRVKPILVTRNSLDSPAMQNFLARNWRSLR